MQCFTFASLIILMKNFYFVLCLFISFPSFAQSDSKYDPHVLFSPLIYQSSVNEYRSANGEPGPKFWQNKASYQINASLDDVQNEITGSVTITYINNSPHALDFLWLQLDQNLYDLNSRGHLKIPALVSSRYGDINTTFNGGYKLSTVKILATKQGKITELNVTPVITDTRMQIIKHTHPRIPLCNGIDVSIFCRENSCSVRTFLRN